LFRLPVVPLFVAVPDTSFAVTSLLYVVGLFTFGYALVAVVRLFLFSCYRYGCRSRCLRRCTFGTICSGSCPLPVDCLLITLVCCCCCVCYIYGIGYWFVWLLRLRCALHFAFGSGWFAVGLAVVRLVFVPSVVLPTFTFFVYVPFVYLVRFVLLRVRCVLVTYVGSVATCFDSYV